MKTTHISSLIAPQKNVWTGKDNSSEKHQPSADEFHAQCQGGAHTHQSQPKGDQRG